MSDLTKKDVDFLLGLVDAEIKRICKEAGDLIPTPGPDFVTPGDRDLLAAAKISWDGDERT